MILHRGSGRPFTKIRREARFCASSQPIVRERNCPDFCGTTDLRMQIGWGLGCLAPERRYEGKDTRHPAWESSAFSRGVISDGIRCDWRHSGKFKYILDGIFDFY